MKCIITDLKNFMEKKQGCLYPSTFSLTGLPFDRLSHCNSTEQGEDDDQDNFGAYLVSRVNRKNLESETQNCYSKKAMSRFEMNTPHVFMNIFVSVSDPCQLVDIDISLESTGAYWYFTRIILSYQVLETIEDREDYMFSFNAFISAVGGNLGLFLGFSLLTAVFDLLDLMEKMIQKFQRR